MKKLLVVSGGTKGIGRAIAFKFASEGFDIITCSRHPKDLVKLTQELKSEFKVNIHTLPVDLSKKNEVENFISFIKEKTKNVDVLINNTGVFLPGQIHQEEDGVLEKMINTNLYSAYHLTRGILGGMIERRAGHIFNICSTASITPYINGGSYCISKYALLGMTKVLREEMKAHQIRVTAVLPGATLTASWEGVDLPEERFMKPEDVAEVIYSGYTLSANTVIEELLIRPQLGDIG
jgi:short-subunit dehydrogenase